MSINKVPFFRFLLVFLSIIVFMVLVWQGTSKAIIEESKEEKTASYFDEVFLCGFQDSFQKIRLFETSPKRYEVYMPGEMRTDVRVEFDGFEKIQIGSVSYRSGEELTDIYQPETYTMRAIDSKGNVLEEAKVHFYFSVFVPSVYIELEIGSMEILNSQKGLKGNAGFKVITEEGKKDASGKCSIKTRGNTSFLPEQKSYSLNLTTGEQEILGMSSCSEWTLLANYKNTTHQMKNKMALDLAALMGMEFTPESRFVNVYLDHQYQGLYLMTQKVSADGGSVKFSEENKAEAVSGPYLMEMDARYEEEPVWFSTQTKKFVLKYPKNANNERKRYVSSYMMDVENALFSKTGCEKYLDFDSWVRMYLLQEFFVQWDVEFASFFVYKKNGDTRLYSGPVWDFDLTCGELFWGYYPRLAQRTLFVKDNGGWLAELEKSAEFSEALKKIYREDFAPLLETYLEQDFEEQVSRLASSSFMNSKRWGRGETDSSGSMRTAAEELRLWIAGRKDFLYQYWEDETRFQKIVFQFGWRSMPYYVKKGEKIGFLPCEEYGEIDYSEYGTIIGWQEQSGQMVTEDFVVTKDEFFYPVYKE